MKKENRGGPREGAGRPRLEKGLQKRRNLTLSDESMEIARGISQKGASDGIRIALLNYQVMHNERPTD